MWGELYQELTFGAMGCGVAVGDYDGDGRPDIFVVSKTETSRLFRNLGNWKFEDVTEKAGLNAPAGVWDQSVASVKRWLGQSTTVSDKAGEPWKQGATFADVSNDGRLDLYVCRFGAPNLLYINQGDGTFKEEAAARGLAVSDASGMAAFCDYDRDGWLDVYVQTNMLNAAEHPNGQRDYLFHNNRDGTFTDVTDRAGIRGETAGHSVTWWDYDNDGWPDIYVANDYAVPDSLYHNNRDGTFTNTIDRTLPHVPYYAMGSDLGDVNNDGLIDLFVADMAASNHQKDQRGMAGSRAMNKENKENSSTVPQYMRNALYLNTATGSFLEAATLAGVNATDWTWSVRFEDLDNDGRLDLYVTNGMIREYHNADILERIMAGENRTEQRRLMRASPVMAESHFAFRNLGDLRFENVSAAWGLDQKGVSFGAAFGDFDGDGDLDLVYTNYQSGATLLRNDSDTGHRIIVALHGTQSNRFGVGATVRIETAAGVQIRQLVLARGYLSSSEPVLHFGLGADERITRMTVSWPGGHQQIFENLSTDRRFTITEPSSPVTPPAVPAAATPGQFTEISHSENVLLFAHEAEAVETNTQPLLPKRFRRLGPALAVSDLNGDGRDDLILGGTTKDPAQIQLSNASGQFAAPTTLPSTGNTLDDGPVLVFDANGDGSTHLLLTKGGTRLPAGARDYQPSLFLNDGHGTFRPASADALPSLPISVGAVAAADWNHDGRLDLFIGARVRPGQYPLPPRSALLVNRGGKFEDVTDTVAPGLREIGMVTSALWTDVDNDGWPDLLIALEWGGVRYWHNNAGRGFEDFSERAGFTSAGVGWWNSLAAADFNGDGRLDYVAGNVGLNTPYQASGDQPALLYYGDFKGGGAPLLIEAYYDENRAYPRRTRNELGALIPSILKRYPKNDLYARATLDEILGVDRLAAAKRFTATELRSGVFLSQPDGTYRFEPLPRIAQISPIQGVVAGDFDGDGYVDIYAVQNSFAPNSAIGHFDGGLSQLLRGDGHGHFTAVPAAESNLVVTGDAKALAVLDLDEDGWPDFVVTRNNNASLAFRNNSVSGHHSFRVVLRGPAGNPTAVGARVTVELTDGSTQTSEIQAGSGYFSQSSAACFFGYRDAVPPRRLKIRWPSGATTTHEVTAPTKTVTIAAPKDGA